MSEHDLLRLRVRETEMIAPTLRRVVFEAADGTSLPSFGPGAHLLLHLQGETRRWKNAYSLACPPGHQPQWQIIVRRTTASRGGSALVHQALREGDIVRAAAPQSLLPIMATARRHLLLAAGIGLTPFLSFLPQLQQIHAAWELHHIARADEADAFAALLADHPGAHRHIGRAAFDAVAVLACQKLGTHLYVCGPAGFMDDMLSVARRLGWPENRLHRESFGTASTGTPFRADLARSGITLNIAADQTLLEAIEDAGIDAPSLCRGGACGVCRTTVLDGEVEHFDHVLTPTERAANHTMMPCVSRARAAHLVLDI